MKHGQLVLCCMENMGDYKIENSNKQKEITSIYLVNRRTIFFEIFDCLCQTNFVTHTYPLTPIHVPMTHN